VTEEADVGAEPAADLPPGSTPGDSSRRLSPKARRIILRAVAVVVVVLCTVLAVRGRWHDFTESIGDMDWRWIPVSFLLACLAPVLCGFAWRALLGDLGSAIPAGISTRIFLLAQMGKFVPGSVWPLVAQTEMAKEQGVPRARSAAANVALQVLTVTLGAWLGSALLPFGPDLPDSAVWAGVICAGVGAVLVSPRVFNYLVSRLLTLMRRRQLEHPLTWHGLWRGSVWTVLNWVALGLHLAVLVVAVGSTSPGLVAASIGVFAIAWIAGFLFVLAPAGIGVREFVLTAALTPSVGAGGALAVAVTSRLVLVLVDVALGAGAALSSAVHARKRAAAAREG
jgi:uncharacterized membrane protein YbhN (UPF0104 family)